MKAVIFDMDGVIFSTENYWKESFNFLSEKYNLNLSEELRRKTSGTNYFSMLKILEPNLKGLNPEKFIYEWCELVEKNINEKGIIFNAGFEELIKFLKSKNFKIGLATGSTRTMINNYFLQNNQDENEVFDAIVSAQDIKNGKPSPDIYLQVCKILKIKPEECYVIEDSKNGINAGLSAGCKVIIKEDIMKPPKKLKDKCIFTSKSLKNIKKFLEKNIK